MANRKSSRAPILASALALLAGPLLLLLPLPAPAAGSVEDYLSASAAGDQGKSQEAYLRGLSARELLDLGQQLAEGIEKKQSFAVRGKTRTLSPDTEGAIYAFSAILTVYAEKAAPVKVSALMDIMKDPSKSSLWKRMLLEHFTSKLSPLSAEEKAELTSGTQEMDKEAADDALVRMKLSLKRIDAMQERVRKIRVTDLPTAEKDAQIQALAPRAAEHFDEILRDLEELRSVELRDIQRLTDAYMGYSRMGFTMDRERMVALAKRLFAEEGRVKLHARVALAGFLGNRMGENAYLGELDKMRKDPRLQSALASPSIIGTPIMETLEDEMIRSIRDDYDKLLAFLKTLTPGDSLYRKTSVLIKGMRQDMIQKGEWTRERALAHIAAYEAARARATDPLETEHLDAKIAGYKKELQQFDSTSTSSAATTAPAPALSPTPLPSGN